MCQSAAGRSSTPRSLRSTPFGLSWGVAWGRGTLFCRTKASSPPTGDRMTSRESKMSRWSRGWSRGPDHEARPPATGSGARLLLPGMLHLLVIYVIWGSTYLAIRVAVREGSGFPPFTMGALRTLIGGSILLGLAALRHHRLRPTTSEIRVLVASGLLLWVGGNGLVTWAETRAESGYAALIIATIPIWVALMDALIDRRSPPPLLIFSLLIGLAGIGVLSAPHLAGGDARDLAALAALLLAPFCWALGSVLQRRRPVGVAPQVSAAYQQLFGSVGFFAVALLVHEPPPAPTPEATLAWVYLVIMGSVVAFSSYVAAPHLLPTRS